MALETLTVIVQTEGPTAAFTPVPPTVKVPVPAVAVMVGVPPQLFTTPGTAAIARLGASASENVRPVRAGEPAGFVMVKVSVEDWPTPTVVGEKAFVSDGTGCTVRQLDVTELVRLASEAMLPDALVCVAGTPAQFVLVVLEVTSTVIVHEAWAADIVAPVTVIVPVPAAAVTTPGADGKFVVILGVAATLIAEGRLSVKLMPDCAGLPAPLVIVKVSVDVPPVSMVAGASALLSEACATFNVRLAVPPVSATGPVAVTAALVLA